MDSLFDELYTKKEISIEDIRLLSSLQKSITDIGASKAIIDVLGKAIHNARAENLIKLADEKAELDFEERKRVLHYV